jgi:hypothetical protein
MPTRLEGSIPGKRYCPTLAITAVDGADDVVATAVVVDVIVVEVGVVEEVRVVVEVEVVLEVAVVVA